MTEERIINKVLITGISGSGGSYLSEYILNNKKNVEVHGLSRWHSSSNNSNLVNILDKIVLHDCDLNDLSNLFKIINKIKPDAIFHLASNANVRASFDNPISVIENNVKSTVNLLESIRMANYDPIIQICSTSEVYGQVTNDDVPIKETTQLKPSSPYSVSKITQDMLGYTYYVSYKMKIIRTRMFSYFNPRREDLFATSFAKQVALVERGMLDKVRHGNLDSIRTMIDVRDAMRAYWEAITKCKFGEAYNIGGSTQITVKEFLDKLISLADKHIPTFQDPQLLRPSDVTLQIPCVDKFLSETGFKTKYSFEESITDLLNYWRKEADKEFKKINS